MLIAHRGKIFLNQETENTIDDFQKAINIGVDGIETDLRMTKCGTIILHHDDHISNNKINNLTYQEIKELDNTIPTLREFLTFITNQKQWNGILDLEIKTYGLTNSIYDILEDFTELLDRIIFTSFLHHSVWEIKNLFSKVKIGLLYRCFPTNFELSYFNQKIDYIVLYKETLIDNQ
jgi:glycerophosphoryl diester phosphodiesterase